MLAEDIALCVFSVTFWTKMLFSTVYSESLPKDSDMEKAFLTNFVRVGHCQVWILRRDFRSEHWVNLCLHTLYEKGLSPVCVLRCKIRLWRTENDFFHTVHDKCLSSVCTLRCLLRWEESVNLFLQTSQEKGRSPVCILRCLFRLESWQNNFLYTWHEKCLPSLCTVIWRIKSEDLLNISLRNWQEKGRSPVCIERWLFRWESWVNIFLHSLQEKVLSPVCTLVCISGLKWSVKPFLHTLHMKGFLRPRIVCISLPLEVNNVKHVSQPVNISLSRSLVWRDILFIGENVFLHISHESYLSFLCVSENSAHRSARSSSILVSLMKCDAPVLVAFNLTLWKKKCLRGHSRKCLWNILQHWASHIDTLRDEPAARWHCVTAHPTQNKLRQTQLCSYKYCHGHGSCIGNVAYYTRDNMNALIWSFEKRKVTFSYSCNLSLFVKFKFPWNVHWFSVYEIISDWFVLWFAGN
jgi:hypothetical protein